MSRSLSQIQGHRNRNGIYESVNKYAHSWLVRLQLKHNIVKNLRANLCILEYFDCKEGFTLIQTCLSHITVSMLVIAGS